MAKTYLIDKTVDDLENYYSKTNVDNLLSTKANSSDIPTFTNKDTLDEFSESEEGKLLWKGSEIETDYDLPIASSEVLGGVKIGSNLEISEDGTLSAVGGGSGAVQSVNGKTGVVVLTATDVGAISEDDLTESKFDEDGETIDIGDMISGGSGGSGESTIRYNNSTDYIQCKVDGTWTNYKRAHLKILLNNIKGLNFEVSKINRGGYVQFSEIVFKNSEGERLDLTQYTHTITCSGSNTDGSLENGIDNNTSTKICVGFSNSFYYKIIFDQNIPFKEYNIFEFYNGNDNSSQGRIPTTFTLSFTEDGNEWETVVSEENVTPLTTSNYEKAYEKTISF